ncbi:MAG: methylenetetrahydrofolate reductase [Pseudomonadota bacterium]
MGSLTSIASAEVTAHQGSHLQAASSAIQPGLPVFIAALPSTTADELITTAKAASALGLEPVPHLVARNMTSEEQFAYVVDRLVTEADVERALVLGGDRSIPAGPFSDALSLLNSGILNPQTISKVAFGCYPEGHPKIAKAQLEKSLFAKLEIAEDLRLKTRLITQICFDASTILAFVRLLRAKGIAAPLRYGVVGPTKITTLLKYAAVCGVGASLKTLAQQRTLSAKLLAGYTPDALIESISHAVQAEQDLGIIGPHFFTFGSLKRTLNWLAVRKLPNDLTSAAYSPAAV